VLSGLAVSTSSSNAVENAFAAIRLAASCSVSLGVMANLPISGLLSPAHHAVARRGMRSKQISDDSG
jgi:hypothetical protein